MLIIKNQCAQKGVCPHCQVMQDFKNNKELYSYNLLGLVGVALSYPINQQNKYFCSQFVAEVFEKSGLNLWGLPPALVTPNDFFSHPKFEIVYEGKLYDYPLLDKDPLFNISMNQFHKQGS